MTEPFVGQITQFGFNYPPYQWAFCDGTVIQIQQNTALYALLGITYGGNGTTNFQLPDFRGSVVCGPGAGPGLTPRTMGEAFGSNAVTLQQPELPRHRHPINFFAQNQAPQRHVVPQNGDVLTIPTATTTALFAPAATASNTTLAPQLLAPAGNTQPHENRQPYLAVNFSIALYGVFPSFP